MNKILSFYYALPHDSKWGIFSKVLNRIAARIIKRYLDKTMPRKFDIESSRKLIGINTTEIREKKYIVSLTSFPARIEDVWISIETILRQTFRPDAIILWLSEDQFKGIELPSKLKNLEKRGLTIKFVSGDIRSHKKYKYALDQYPDDYIITLDDDLYYDKNLIENLVELKEKYPNCIPSNRAHKIKFNDDKIDSYNNWIHNSFQKEPSYSLVQTGGFGTLYSSQDLFLDYNKEGIFLKLTPYADDLWLKFMVLLKGNKIITNNRYNKDPITVKGTQENKLVSHNILNGGNDVQFENLLKHYNLQTSHFKD